MRTLKGNLSLVATVDPATGLALSVRAGIIAVIVSCVP
jgi:hypothetical protein